MEKLKKYNQKLLAILGTLAVVAAGIGVISALVGGVIVISDYLSRGGAQDYGVRVVDTQVQEDGDTVVSRIQAVTFNEPVYLDSNYLRYVVPVGQVDLKEREEVSYESSYKILNAYSRARYGRYNNFVYVDFESKLKTKIFHERVSISQWMYYAKNSVEALLFKGALEDSDNNGVLDSEDTQSLFVLWLNDFELKQYDFESTLLEFSHLQPTKYINLEIGLDVNGDGQYSRRFEPRRLSILDMQNRTVQPLVPNELEDEIQRVIDGM